MAVVSGTRSNLTSDAAQGFPGDADIGGNHMLWHPLNAFWVDAHQFNVLFLCGFA